MKKQNFWIVNWLKASYFLIKLIKQNSSFFLIIDKKKIKNKKNNKKNYHDRFDYTFKTAYI